MSILSSNRGSSPGEILDTELERMDHWMDTLPEPGPGEPELTDAEIAEHMPLVGQGIAEVLREFRDGTLIGPILVIDMVGEVPDYTGIDPEAVKAAAESSMAEWAIQDRIAEETGDDEHLPAALSPAARELLTSSPAGLALLETLDRGLEASTPEVSEVMLRRVYEARLPEWVIDGCTGWLDYPPR